MFHFKKAWKIRTNMDQNQIIEILVKRGNELLGPPYKIVEFTKNQEADRLLNDLNKYPHAFVLACIMDRQIKAERAWLIPFYVSKKLGSFEFKKLIGIDLQEIKNIFKNNNLHRFNDIMANNFYSGIQLIHNKYDSDASIIWKDKPKSATIVRRFLEFKGIGVKISTMAVNILSRDFKIPMQDRICIDISPDRQVKKVFYKIGLISKDASNDELIYCARELYPEYPGIFDLSAWEIGRQWCKTEKPNCNECYLDKFCPKIV